MSEAPDTIEMNGKTWKKVSADDNSAFWYEFKASYGELVVEQENDDLFSAYWWPPEITSGSPDVLGDGYETQRAAMEAAHGYIDRLKELLAE